MEIFRALRGPSQGSKEKERIHKGESTPNNMSVFLIHVSNCRLVKEDIESFFRRRDREKGL